MTGSLPLPKRVIILAITLPLAAFLGLLLATPTEFTSLAGVGLVLGILVLPVVLRWHYAILVLSWNAAVNISFLPGQPRMWMLMACISFFLTGLAYVMNRNNRLQNVPELTWSILVFTLVVLGTALLTGGLGLRSMGSDTYGGRKYFTIIFAVIGYFALSTQKIPRRHAYLFVSGFLLMGLTLALGNFAYLAGDRFYWLFYVFPIDYVVNQATEDFHGAASAVKFGRLSGLTWAGLSVFSWMLVRYGLRGILDVSAPWRLALALGLFAVSLLGGFRSIVVIYVLIVAIQAVIEGLHRTKLLPVLATVGVIGYVTLMGTATALPLSVQRSLSVLPGMRVDAMARADARASTDWRLRMWQVLMAEVPKHVLMGKGYTANATDYWLAMESFRRGYSEDYEASLIAGDYHNGPLSIVIPFGIWGVIAFAVFIYYGIRALYRNYRYGPEELRRINGFLLAYFLARLLFFMVVFGGISGDLWLFGGIIGLSVALNHGVAKVPTPESLRELEAAKLREQPAAA